MFFSLSPTQQLLILSTKAETLVKKDLIYNETERDQISELSSILSENRFNALLF